MSPASGKANEKRPGVIRRQTAIALPRVRARWARIMGAARQMVGALRPANGPRLEGLKRFARQLPSRQRPFKPVVRVTQRRTQNWQALDLVLPNGTSLEESRPDFFSSDFMAGLPGLPGSRPAAGGQVIPPLEQGTSYGQRGPQPQPKKAEPARRFKKPAPGSRLYSKVEEVHPGGRSEVLPAADDMEGVHPGGQSNLPPATRMPEKGISEPPAPSQAARPETAGRGELPQSAPAGTVEKQASQPPAPSQADQARPAGPVAGSPAPVSESPRSQPPFPVRRGHSRIEELPVSHPVEEPEEQSTLPVPPPPAPAPPSPVQSGPVPGEKEAPPEELPPAPPPRAIPPASPQPEQEQRARPPQAPPGPGVPPDIIQRQPLAEVPPPDREEEMPLGPRPAPPGGKTHPPAEPPVKAGAIPPTVESAGPTPAAAPGLSQPQAPVPARPVAGQPQAPLPPQQAAPFMPILRAAPPLAAIPIVPPARRSPIFLRQQPRHLRPAGETLTIVHRRPEAARGRDVAEERGPSLRPAPGLAFPAEIAPEQPGQVRLEAPPAVGPGNIPPAEAEFELQVKNLPQIPGTVTPPERRRSLMVSLPQARPPRPRTALQADETLAGQISPRRQAAPRLRTQPVLLRGTQAAQETPFLRARPASLMSAGLEQAPARPASLAHRVARRAPLVSQVTDGFAPRLFPLAVPAQAEGSVVAAGGSGQLPPAVPGESAAMAAFEADFFTARPETAGQAATASARADELRSALEMTPRRSRPADSSGGAGQPAQPGQAARQQPGPAVAGEAKHVQAPQAAQVLSTGIIQRLPEEEAGPQVGESEPLAPATEEPEHPAPDPRELAKQVYPIIKRMLAQERERRHGSG
jgi:hypothetical protein